MAFRGESEPNLPRSASEVAAEVATRTPRQTGVRSPNRPPRLWNSRAKDSNLRPVDKQRVHPRARAQKSKRLARRKSRRQRRNAAESYSANRTQTVLGEEERDWSGATNAVTYDPVGADLRSARGSRPPSTSPDSATTQRRALVLPARHGADRGAQTSRPGRRSLGDLELRRVPLLRLERLVERRAC